jgi:starch-binding outer membrane protein, SusD/RagB family
MYGLTPSLSGTNLAMAVLYERQIELAYEGKRYYDLRRWKLVESTLNGTQREGLTILLKPIPAGTTGNGTDYLAATRDAAAVTNLDAVYTQYFSYAPVILSNSSAVLGELKNLDTAPIAFQTADYYFGIPTGALQSDPNIQQTNTWGGSFDPTK